MAALGMLEFNSIPSGILAGDEMLKAADVHILSAQPVCAGKYIVMVGGEVAAVASAMAAGRTAGSDAVVDETLIPNVHPQVPAAILNCVEVGDTDALGVIETFSAASSVLAADAAVKSSQIWLIEVRLARGLGGKAFITFTGEVSAVEHAVKSALGSRTDAMIASWAVIPSPHPDIMKSLY
jgi:microcompartment protein CcmL/EutN